MHPFSERGFVGSEGLVTYRAASGERGAGEKSRPRSDEGAASSAGGAAACGGGVVGGVVGPFSCGGAAATAGARSELVATTNLKRSKKRMHESAAVRRDFII